MGHDSYETEIFAQDALTFLVHTINNVLPCLGINYFPCVGGSIWQVLCITRFTHSVQVYEML